MWTNYPTKGNRWNKRGPVLQTNNNRQRKSTNWTGRKSNVVHFALFIPFFWWHILCESQIKFTDFTVVFLYARLFIHLIQGVFPFDTLNCNNFRNSLWSPEQEENCRKKIKVRMRCRTERPKVKWIGIENSNKFRHFGACAKNGPGASKKMRTIEEMGENEKSTNAP